MSEPCRFVSDTHICTDAFGIEIEPGSNKVCRDEAAAQLRERARDMEPAVPLGGADRAAGIHLERGDRDEIEYRRAEDYMERGRG